MSTLVRLRAALDRLRQEALRATAAREGTERRGDPDAYHFDLRSEDIVLEEQANERVDVVPGAVASSEDAFWDGSRRRELGARLRDKQSLRELVLLSELLQPPLALRRPRR